MNEAKLSELFGGRKRYALLQALYRNPGRRWTNKELVEQTGAAVGNVSRWLTRWATLGLVEKYVDGRNITYRASADPLLAALYDLMSRNDAVLADIREALPNEVTVAVVFGSNAKGTERAGSDIDVLVVTMSSVSELKVNAALRPVGRKHNRSINAVVYTGAEFERLLQAQDCFALDVACNPTIPLIGDFGAFVSTIRTQRSGS